MSGSGRKSSYRKSITDKFSTASPLPASPREVLRIRSCRGANIFEVESANGDIDLALLPNKFKNLIWIKRDDYVLVETSIDAPVNDTSSSSSSSTSPSSSGKIKYIIKTILNRDQIKHIQAEKLWPAEFDTGLGAGRENTAGISKDELMPGYNSEDMEDSDILDELETSHVQDTSETSAEEEKPL